MYAMSHKILLVDDDAAVEPPRQLDCVPMLHFRI